MTIDDPTVLNRMSRRFRNFSEQDGQDDPLYAALARHIADEPQLCGLLAEAPPGQQLPVLLLAALHDVILDDTAARTPLHDYYPTVGGHRQPDDALPHALRTFVAMHRSRLLQTLRTRATQTNEIGRCGVLRVALQALMERLNLGRPAPHPIALFDFGCSAGLNLLVQDYGYDDGWDLQPAGEASAPLIRGRWRRPPPASLQGPRRWQVCDAIGVDPAPVDVTDALATRWLRACVWPHDEERGGRLRQALALAAARPQRLVAADDGLQVLDRWLARLPDGVQPVMVNTWVLAYLDAQQRAHLNQTLAGWIGARGLAWISGEAGKFSPVATLPPTGGPEPADTTTLWTLQWRDADRVLTEALAWSHAHGKWMDWLPNDPL